MTLNVGSGKEGLTIWYELYCASIPAGKIFRPLQGTFRMPKSRTSVAGRSVPVRWNTFGDGTRPVDGGGTGALKNGPNAGNWSSYTWAQYNPRAPPSRHPDGRHPRSQLALLRLERLRVAVDLPLRGGRLDGHPHPWQLRLPASPSPRRPASRTRAR